MTLWIEWYDHRRRPRRALHLEQPARTRRAPGKRFGFPNTTFLEYAGDGKFSFEGDYYNPADAEKVFGEWLEAGGRRSTPQDHVAEGHRRLEPARRRSPRSPARRSRRSSPSTASGPALAVETGDWDQWADQFTDDAHYREHHYGYFKSQQEIRDWIKSVMQPFPTMEFPVSYYTDRRQPGQRPDPEHPARRPRATTATTASTSTRSSTTPATGSGASRRTSTRRRRPRRSSPPGSRPGA